MDATSIDNIRTRLPSGVLVNCRYWKRSGTSTFDSAETLDQIEERPTTKDESQGQASFTINHTKIFCIWKQDLERLSMDDPKHGDKITITAEDGSDGTVWMVGNVSIELMGRRFKLSCTRGL